MGSRVVPFGPQVADEKDHVVHGPGVMHAVPYGELGHEPIARDGPEISVQ